jgi:hypothetical protein
MLHYPGYQWQTSGRRRPPKEQIRAVPTEAGGRPTPPPAIKHVHETPGWRRYALLRWIRSSAEVCDGSAGRSLDVVINLGAELEVIRKRDAVMTEFLRLSFSCCLVTRGGGHRGKQAPCTPASPLARDKDLLSVPATKQHGSCTSVFATVSRLRRSARGRATQERAHLSDLAFKLVHQFA